MKRKFETLLWVIILFGLGFISHALFSYVVVEVTPVSSGEVLTIINEKISKTEKDFVATELILFPEMKCRPFLRNTVEKRCTQNAIVVFSNGTTQPGTCTTWSYKGYHCDFPPASRINDDLAKNQKNPGIPSLLTVLPKLKKDLCV